MYIENYTIWKDIKLILQTLIVFFKSDSTEGFDEKPEVTLTRYGFAEKEKKVINEKN